MALTSLENLMNELSLANNKESVFDKNGGKDKQIQTKTNGYRVNRIASYGTDESDSDSSTEHSDDDYNNDGYNTDSSNSSSSNKSSSSSDDDCKDNNLISRTPFKTKQDGRGIEHNTLNINNSEQERSRRRRNRKVKKVKDYFPSNDHQTPQSPPLHFESPPSSLSTSPSSSYKGSSVLNLNDSYLNSPLYSIESANLSYDSVDGFEKPEDERKKGLQKQLYSLASGRKKIKDISLQKPYANNNALLHDLAEKEVFVIKIDQYLAEILGLRQLKDTLVDLNSYEFATYIIARIQRDVKVKEDPNLINFFFTQKNSSEETPVMIAVRKDNSNLLKLFIPHTKLEDQIQLPFLHNLLQIACKYGSYSCFKYLIDNHYSKEEDITVICCVDVYGDNCLNIAINSQSQAINNVEIVKELLKTKYFIITDCNTYKLSIVENVYFNDHERNSLLHMLEMVRIEQFNQESPVMKALRENKLNLVESLIPYHILDQFQQPAIHILLQAACKHGSYDCFKYLNEYYHKKENFTSLLHLVDINGYNCLNLSIESHSQTVNNVKIIEEIIKTTHMTMNDCQEYNTIILENINFTSHEKKLIFDITKTKMENARIEEFSSDFEEIMNSPNII